MIIQQKFDVSTGMCFPHQVEALSSEKATLLLRIEVCPFFFSTRREFGTSYFLFGLQKE